MNFSRPYGLLASVLGVLVMLVTPVTVGVQSNEDGARTAGRDWTTFGGDWGNQRHSTLKQVNTQTVKNLGAAWTFKFEANSSTRAAPVVKDNRLFISAGTRVYALDATTGVSLWTFKPTETAASSLEDANIGDLLNARSGIPGPQGVALGEGLVFVGLMNGSVAAVRQTNGERVWMTPIGYDPPKTGQSVSGAPVYANGMVFAGLADADWAFRGKSVALDAKTGRKLWEFVTIPDEGEPGRETWPSDPQFGHIYQQGGSGVWHAPAIDPELGMAYFTTGNAVPMFGGEARTGNNLYTASVIALDIKTGKMRWHYQVVHHDLWDADIALPPVLYDTQRDGRPRKGIAAMRADGMLFLLDRETGKPLLPIAERPVTQDAFNKTAPTQPFPVGAEGLMPPCSTWKDQIKPPFVLDCGGFTPPFVDKHNVVAPSVAGAIRVTPISYSPRTGYFYAHGSVGVARARRISRDPWFRGSAPILDGLLPPALNVLVAIDSRTNRIAWKKDLADPGSTGGFLGPLGTSGPLTTDGGLMFRGDASGNLQAYDAGNGRLLWEFQTGSTQARGPAITYEAGGEQYVAVALSRAVWTFKLGGTLPPAPAPPAVRRGPPPGEQTDQIETATLVASAERGVGRRYAMDEDAFRPLRSRIKAGITVTFTNNGQLIHTVEAIDGSWTTGPLVTAQSGYVKLDKPGTIRYHCKDHPWAVGEITVE